MSISKFNINNICTYPEFKPISLEDIEFISTYTSEYLPYSDFNAVSLFVWNTHNVNAISNLNNNLIIRVSDYLSNDFLYGILGNSKLDFSIDLLLDKHSKISFFPESLLHHISENSYNIKLDRDNFDYVLSIDTFTNLSGTKHNKIRKKLNRFDYKYSNYYVRELDILNFKDVDKILNLLYQWCSDKKMSSSELSENHQSVSNFIRASSYFKSINTGLFVNDTLIAFSLNEVINSKWVMGHFGKSLINVRDSALKMEYENSVVLQQLGYEFLNIQQDTGLLGLRKAKVALNPSFYLKKYTIENTS